MFNSYIRSRSKYFDGIGVDGDPNTANGYSKAPVSGSDGGSAHDFAVRAILEVFSPSATSASLLEVGCGTGELLARLTPHYSMARGLDISPVMVDRVRARGLQADGYEGGVLPYPDNSFDHVLLFQVLVNFESLKEVREMLREAWRVVKPAGMVYVGAIPHPNWSGFAPHTISSSTRKRIGALLGRQSLSCFSIPTAFFALQADHLGAVRYSMFPTPVPLPGWSGKYDFVIERGAV